jgi:hypothetical protein
MEFKSARELPRAPSTANQGLSLLKYCSNPATSGVGGGRALAARLALARRQNQSVYRLASGERLTATR